MSVDPAIITVLGLDPETATIRSHGGSGFASSYKLTGRRLDAGSDAPLTHYFVKTGSGPEAEAMFRGEHASLNAIAASAPQFCPRAHAHGQMKDDSSVYFLVTEFLELGGGGGQSSGSQTGSFAAKLAEMHNHEVSPDESGCPEGKPFGFPVPTCCGATEQDNSWKATWAEFYADNRLRHVFRVGQKNNRTSGSDEQLADAVERTASTVVPRLLGDGHLQRSGTKGGGPIRPAVVHGDLWSGNKGRGRILPSSASSAMHNFTSPLVYDPACVYGHSEYELGIMRMFGGFGTSFWNEYTELVPKDEPADEWEDRLALYELYHHLNHYALFGQGYRSGAMSIMSKLLQKYG
ncbi:fructosamine kinase [Ophiostoma piceae UAMH 11346]|uniref:protein-ribulosamine 3-kinase n=1 Tax=Ophiostoma piceae (strain UAMH 11346) TaxID=1262450 RepID=S3BWI8_OPHP1|nr:fructosamine kinase [Ophiostoma piceae UAMH 11346]